MRAPAVDTTGSSPPLFDGGVRAVVAHQLNAWNPPGQRDPARIADQLSDHDVRTVLVDAAPGSKVAGQVQPRPTADRAPILVTGGVRLRA